jgi:hypothetical protein
MTQIYFFSINRKTQPIYLKIILEVKNIVSNANLSDFWRNFFVNSFELLLGPWSDVYHAINPEKQTFMMKILVRARLLQKKIIWPIRTLLDPSIGP